MKHEKVFMDTFRLEEKDLKDVKEFENRDVKSLCPTVVIVKRVTEQSQNISIIIEVADEFSLTEFSCPWSVIENAKGFGDDEDLDGFVEFLIKEHALNWAEVLKFYDENKISS